MTTDLALWRDFVNRPKWFDHARCSIDDIPVDVFFPAGAESDRRDVNESTDLEAAAKKICNACPVRSQCLAYGLHEPAGIWGGRTVRERRRIRRTMAQASA